MTQRNPTTSVSAYLPQITYVTHDTVTLGSGQTLVSHFSAANVAAAEVVWITPHDADMWLFFGGSSAPAASDGHPIPQGTTRELSMHGLSSVKFTGSGECTITIFKYGL